MRKTIVILAAVLAIACKPAVGPAPTPGAPTKIEVSGKKGLFLASGSPSKSLALARSISGRAIITASGAALGAVDANGLPTSVTWTDAGGLAVTATVSQAVQLAPASATSPGYMLLTYDAGSGAVTAAVNLSTGALASFDVVPDNWANIAVSGDTAFYETGGSIYSANLNTGAAINRSMQGTIWDTQVWSTGKIVGTGSWESTTWIYVDIQGSAYCINCDNSSSFMAVVITANGQFDFGNQPSAWQLFQSLPGTSLTYPSWIAYDENTNVMYLLESIETPAGSGTFYLNQFPITLATSGTIISISSTSEIALSASSHFCHIGFGIDIEKSIWTDGAHTWSGSGNTLNAYDTSAVPQSNIYNGQGYAGAVTNWQYSSGQTFAGPASAQTINLVNLSSSTATTSQLVAADTPIISWSPVGGALFWTDSSGTYTGTVNAAAGTLEGVQPYSGGQVQAVTQ